MRLFDLVAALLVMAAGFSYLNHRLLRLPTTIGLMALTLAAAAVAVAAGQFVPAVSDHARAFVGRIDFDDAVLYGMLGFLLFAGALHVDLAAPTPPPGRPVAGRPDDGQRHLVAAGHRGNMAGPPAVRRRRAAGFGRTGRVA